jgi:tRNA(fMet)-specific endonuclease VapC
MIYALDTNTISFLLRHKQNPEVAKRFASEITDKGNSYVIPPLCYYETSWWLMRKSANAQLSVFEELYQSSLVKAEMVESEFLKAAKIRADLDEKGMPIGDANTLIAAYCIVNNFTLVTDNISDFKRIDGLKYVNWKN